MHALAAAAHDERASTRDPAESGHIGTSDPEDFAIELGAAEKQTGATPPN